MRYKVQYVRVLDCRRRYVEASQNYYELSLRPGFSEEEKGTSSTDVNVKRSLSEHARKQALVCAVLAPAGQQRARALATLYKDERCHNLKQFGILQKMYLHRLIRAHELSEFAAALDEHHKATASDG